MKSGAAILLLISVLVSCKRIHSEITVDKLEDKQNYTGGMLVDCSTLNGEKIRTVLLNNVEQFSIEGVDLRSPGYYRLELYTDSKGNTAPTVIRVVILDPERGESEWGLDKWTPRGISPGKLGEEEITLIHSPKIPEDFSYPVVVVAGGGLTASLVNVRAELSTRTFMIKRGVGSAWAAASDLGKSIIQIDQRSFPLTLSIMDASPTLLNGVLEENMQVPAGSFVHITEDLYIPTEKTLSVGEGSFIIVNEGVNIYSEGSLLFIGTEEAPITLSSADEAVYWGGVIATGSGNRIEAAHTIFCRSGFHTGENYDYGHAKRQALFYNENGSQKFTHCYMIDHAGQVFYPRGGSLEINYCLIQRAITGGQTNYCQVDIDHSVFTDFPDDQGSFLDQDNDGLYLSASDATITNSVFMYAVDDGLDSGGSEGGEVHVSNTRFESIFHEGAALSSGGNDYKQHNFSSCVFIDCGQGLELGFSSPNHYVEVDSCIFQDNGVGIRYGDNYKSNHEGRIAVTNSQIMDSHFHDVWNMVRELWEADTAKMVFINVRVSSPNPLYPELIIDE